MLLVGRLFDITAHEHLRIYSSALTPSVLTPSAGLPMLGFFLDIHICCFSSCKGCHTFFSGPLILLGGISWLTPVMETQIPTEQQWTCTRKCPYASPRESGLRRPMNSHVTQCKHMCTCPWPGVLDGVCKHVLYL